MSEHNYLNLLETILRRGDARSDRTGVGTLGVFGPQLRFDMSDGFPLLTTKKVWFKGVLAELLWMLSGDTNVKTLQAQGVHIWDEWADEDGDLGPVYGAQWRQWNAENVDDGYGMRSEGRDQLQELIDGLKRDPFGRRHIVTAWNPDDTHRQKLPPCHCFFQCHVSSDMKLSLHLYQRSADMFLGVPFNIASYALLLHLLARFTGLTPGTFVHTFGDAHIYNSHRQAVMTQLGRTPRRFPKLIIDPRVDSLSTLTYDRITIEGYDPYDKIAAPVAI